MGFFTANITQRIPPSKVVLLLPRLPNRVSLLCQWFLTWGPGTPWGSRTPILRVPNANLEYQQISPNISNMKSIRY